MDEARRRRTDDDPRERLEHGNAHADDSTSIKQVKRAIGLTQRAPHLDTIERQSEQEQRHGGADRARSERENERDRQR